MENVFSPRRVFRAPRRRGDEGPVAPIQNAGFFGGQRVFSWKNLIAPG
jgi:hypothetical protein